MARLTVVNCPSQDLAITNKVFGSAETLQQLGTPYVQFDGGLVYLCRPTRARSLGRLP